MRRRKSIFDDGFQSYLTEGAELVGDAGIPMLMHLDNVQIPVDILPFGKANVCDYSGVPAHQVRSSAQPDHTPAHLS